MDPKESFYRQFQQSTASLQEQIAQLPTLGSERQDAVEHILTRLTRLTDEVADAADHTAAYDQRTYIEVLKALREQLDEMRAQSTKKSRFQFKARSKPADAETKPDTRKLPTAAQPVPALDSEKAEQESIDTVGPLPNVHGDGATSPRQVKKNYNEEIARPGLTGVRKPSFSAAREIDLSDHTGLHIILPPSPMRAASSGTLTNLRGCIIDMSQRTVKGSRGVPFASLALKNISESLVIAGDVDGSVHITGVKDSILVVVARQVRIHECENVDLYLHCASHPIIEDCKGMRFAPAPDCFVGEEERGKNNQWDQVDDFKWLKAEHSPNWSVLPEEERVSFKGWTDTVPGGPSLSVVDILKLVGVGARRG